jgi:uncharacterized protein involved in tellurium resistance
VEILDMDKLNITLPLEAQFTLRRVEMEVEGMSKDELKSLVINLTWQRILERSAITQVLKEENIDIHFDFPTEDEIMEMLDMAESGDESDDPFDFFAS